MLGVRIGTQESIDYVILIIRKLVLAKLTYGGKKVRIVIAWVSGDIGKTSGNVGEMKKTQYLHWCVGCTGECIFQNSNCTLSIWIFHSM